MPDRALLKGIGAFETTRRLSVSNARVWSEAHADARALGHHRDTRRLLGGLLGLGDASLIAITSALAYLLRNGWSAVPAEIVSATGLAILLTIHVLSMAGAYSSRVMDPLPQQIARVARCWSVVFAGLLLLFYVTKTSESYSRTWSIAWYLNGLGMLCCARLVAAVQIARWRKNGRLAGTVAVVDLSGDGEAIGRQLRRSMVDEARLVGVFRIGGDVDGVGDLLALARLFRIDEIFVIAPPNSGADIAGLLRLLGTIPANVSLCPLLPDLAATPIREARMLFGVPVLTMHRKPLSGWSTVLKRAEDLAIGGPALAMLAPLMLLIALAIRVESKGPILFRQKRQGFNNNVFVCFKFRSMLHHEKVENDVIQATRHDKRVTRVGKFLRRTSLDELPQLINVLRGEMSLVGPRPHAVAHNEIYGNLIDDYIGRHRIQPGITGWAQVNGLRGETDTLEKMQRRVQHDLTYIDNWSVLFDLRIMALTVLTLPFHREAY
jgi:Undecaprenyl-phosphate glucose phosphotransferase